jgi:hypothetical protein
VQHVLRPYATAGVALVGASIIAVTPLVAPPPAVQMRPVQLVDAWSDLITNTTANLDSIFSNASSSDISQLFSELVTNPYGVIEAFANFDPTVTTDLASLPATISVELPPGLELAIAGLGATGATFSALESVAQQLQADPSATNLYEGVATVLNAYLNGADNISLLNGAITIPLYNGLLAPETSADVNINLTSLIDALGLGNTSLSNLDLSGLLGQLGLGDVSLSSLLTDLGISGDKLGDLLAGLSTPITSLGGLLNLLGLDGLGTGDGITVALTQVLSGLGLDTNVDLNTLTLSDVLGDFGINSPLSDISGLSLSGILSSFGVDVPSAATLGDTTLSSLLGDLGLGNLGLGTLLQDAVNSGVLGPLGPAVQTLVTLNESLLNEVNLGELLTGVTLGQGVGGSISLDTLLGDLGVNLPSGTDLSSIDIGDVLTSLGITLPGNLSIGTLLGDLGFSSATGDLTLGGLLTDLGDPFGSLSITGLLDNLTLGGLVGDLGLSNLDLDLTNLVGELPTLTLGGLLGDLGLGDLANVSVEPLGGFDTILADLVPQQILASLGV